MMLRRMTPRSCRSLLLTSLTAALLLGSCSKQPAQPEAAAPAAEASLNTLAVGGGLTVDVVTSDVWNSGFNGAVRLRNTAFSAPVTSYEIVFKLAGNAKISGNAWVGEISGPDAAGNYTATNPSWLNPIAVGAGFEQGFGGAGQFSGAIIVSLKVNGQVIKLGTVTPPPPNPGTGDKTAPIISLASSAASVTSASTLTLNATASDNVGVSKVEFYDGAKLLGSKQTAPYTLPVPLTSANNGVHSYTAKAFDAAGNTKTSAAVKVTVNIGTAPPPTSGRMDNPFVGAKWYVNQDWAAKARADGGAAIAGYNTAVWMDRIGAIAPTTPGTLGLRGHLDAALAQGANVFTMVVYDLPNRDCFALASNGELRIKENGFNRYKTEYITPIAKILSDPKYKNIRIAAVIEPDSLPNLVTNTSDPDCQEAAGPGGYVEATQFTLNTLYDIPNVYSYIDIGHSGWLGWDDNFSKASTLIADAIKGTVHGVNSVAGFVSNTANTTPTTEPFLDALASSPLPGSNGGTQVRQAKFYEFNPNFSELTFVQAWRTRMISLGFPASIGMLIDTSRNGWGGPARPTKLSTSSNVDTFVNESRIDRRTHRGMWCNQASGIGERPVAAPAPGLDAYIWVKPPGESDGVAKAGIIDPTDPAKGFDRFCDPTFVVPSNGQITGALPNAPHAGRWFSEGFKILLKNAYPPLK